MSHIKRVDHIAIAVKSIETSRPLFETLYGARFLLIKENPAGQYRAAFFQVGEDIFTMLEGTDPNSFVSKHVEQRGEGIQHLGIEVDNLDGFLAEVEALGGRVSNRLEVDGVRKEALISPRSAFGIILQPIEWSAELKDLSPDQRFLKAAA